MALLSQPPFWKLYMSHWGCQISEHKQKIRAHKWTVHCTFGYFARPKETRVSVCGKYMCPGLGLCTWPPSLVSPLPPTLARLLSLQHREPLIFAGTLVVSISLCLSRVLKLFIFWIRIVGIFFPLSHEKQAKKIVSNCNKKYTNDDLKNKNPQCTSQIRKWGVVSRVQSIKKGKLKPSSPNC